MKKSTYYKLMLELTAILKNQPLAEMMPEAVLQGHYRESVEEYYRRHSDSSIDRELTLKLMPLVWKMMDTKNLYLNRAAVDAEAWEVVEHHCLGDKPSTEWSTSPPEHFIDQSPSC